MTSRDSKQQSNTGNADTKETAYCPASSALVVDNRFHTPPLKLHFSPAEIISESFHGHIATLLDKIYLGVLPREQEAVWAKRMTLQGKSTASNRPIISIPCRPSSGRNRIVRFSTSLPFRHVFFVVFPFVKRSFLSKEASRALLGGVDDDRTTMKVEFANGLSHIFDIDPVACPFPGANVIGRDLFPHIRWCSVLPDKVSFLLLFSHTPSFQHLADESLDVTAEQSDPFKNQPEIVQEEMGYWWSRFVYPDIVCEYVLLALVLFLFKLLTGKFSDGDEA